MRMISEINSFLAEPFNKYVAIAMLVLGTIAFFFAGGGQPSGQADGNVSVNFFYLPTCPHCSEQKPILYELEKEMPNVSFSFHDASTPEGSRLFYQFASEAGMDLSQLAVPTTFVGKNPLVGTHSKEEIMDEIELCQANCAGEKPEVSGSQQALGTNLEEFDLPFIGRTDLTSISLPALAALLGLIDGFNPCAMWVLVYLIALLININDRKKFWIIVGSFVLASGVLYFLFMTAWLNAFLIIGYMRIVTVLIGMVALGGGILSLKEYFATQGSLACKVVDQEGHKKTEGEIKQIISSPLSAGLLLSIIALAFLVNSVEFACSSAIPAVFTQVLAISEIGELERYAYILLYDFFFMLDDLIIFALAGFAIAGGIGERYAKYCKLVGGAVMAILGALLLFAPNLLR